MSRNSSGNYSLPVPETPFLPRTVINATDMNTVMSDISTEISDSLSRSGKGGMTAPLQLPDGTSAAPGLTFSGDTNTGLYRVGADILGFAAGGSVKAELTTTQLLTIDGALATPGLSFIADTNTGLYRAGADDLRIAAGGVDIAKATTKLSVSAATAATGGTRQDALTISNGDIDMSGVAAPTSTTALTNRLAPSLIPKAWACVAITNATPFVPSISAGANITSIARGTASRIDVVFAAAMASGNYAVIACLENVVGAAVNPISLATNGFSMTLSNDGGTLTIDSLATTKLYFVVFAVQ